MIYRDSNMFDEIMYHECNRLLFRSDMPRRSGQIAISKYFPFLLRVVVLFAENPLLSFVTSLVIVLITFSITARYAII